MAIPKRKKPGKLPLCGDKLIDIYFQIIVDSICYKISSIKKKKAINNPYEKDHKERRKALYGLYDPNTNEIYLSASKCKHPTKKSMIPTLVHEILHEVLPTVFHRRIYQLEYALVNRFTEAQKRYLRHFIPKYQVKVGPKVQE